MDVIFDDTALELLRAMGYQYFYKKEIPPPVLDPNEGLYGYCEMIPFKTKASALKHYLSFQKPNSTDGVWWDDEHLKELSGGMFGLIVYVKMSEDVFS